ncbi:MAG: hypothetical protein V3T09_08550 [bacterium]
MSDFSGLKKSLEISSDAKKFYLTDITLFSKDSGKQEIPWFMIRHAGESNAKYFNKLLKLNKKAARKIQAGNADVDTIEEIRDTDRDIFFDTEVIVGWGNVFNSNGEVSKFSKEHWDDFSSSLPNWLFDKIRNFGADQFNFVDSCDIKEIAKN